MKMLIDVDGVSTMNVIAHSSVQHCHLKVKCHPYPFKVVWVNEANLTYIYKMPIQIDNHTGEILCDVLPMLVVHILLGQPWFYDLSALYNGNT